MIIGNARLVERSKKSNRVRLEVVKSSSRQVVHKSSRSQVVQVGVQVAQVEVAQVGTHKSGSDHANHLKSQ